jgi:hypothetical protein
MRRFNKEEIEKALESRKDHSAWSKGVTAYALEMLETIEEMIDYYGEPETLADLEAYALNGAESWSEYSWAGSSLIYDGDIAKRLCTASELKRTKGGEKRPNAEEEWLDTQARALAQAFNLVAEMLK